MAKSGKQVTFEDAIGRVEQIIEQIEAGEIGLEQSLAKYEQGMKLLNDCRGILDKAEKRIAELTVDGRGKLKNKGADEQSSDDDGDDEDKQGRLI